MGYRAEYGVLLEELAREADALAIRYFRADEIRIDRKDDGSAVTQADRAVEEMARARVASPPLVGAPSRVLWRLSGLLRATDLLRGAGFRLRLPVTAPEET